MSVASTITEKSAEDSAAATQIIELPASELDELISRVEQAKQAQLCLSAHDCDLLLNAVLTLATMQERLSHNDLTVTKLKKLLGIVRSSERPAICFLMQIRIRKTTRMSTLAGQISRIPQRAPPILAIP